MGTLPSQWKKSPTLCIWKDTNVSSPTNYHPVSFCYQSLTRHMSYMCTLLFLSVSKAITHLPMGSFREPVNSHSITLLNQWIKIGLRSWKKKKIEMRFVLVAFLVGRTHGQLVANWSDQDVWKWSFTCIDMHIYLATLMLKQSPPITDN